MSGSARTRTATCRLPDATPRVASSIAAILAGRACAPRPSTSVLSRLARRCHTSARVEHDLALPGLPREKELAAIVSLLDQTAIRVGNEEYTRENGSYGLTTLRNGHVTVEGATLRFCFRGKSGKEHEVDAHDQRVARIVRKMEDLPGQRLFEY
jgi:Eukaryotic DNA topoisomerase I, catalytic core